jgi:hypothetical protein
MLVVMVDAFFEAVQSAAAWIGGQSAWDIALLCLALGVIGLPSLALVHEFGHAFAAWLRGLPLKSIVVGDTDDLTLRVGTVILRLGRWRSSSQAGGYVLLAPTQASATDVIVVALGGPLANLAVVPGLVALAQARATDGTLELCLWVLAVWSASIAVSNLIPRGTPGTSELLSDGRLVELAWKQRGTPVAISSDAAPPQSCEPSVERMPESRSKFRWPFAAALLSVAVIAVAVGGIVALVPLVVVFGGALLNDAHHDKLR